MPSTVQQLVNKGLINPPSFLPTNVQMEVIMGSVAYGVSSDLSDLDIYGFCICPLEMTFPHLAGEIEGFGRHKKRFHQYEKHHVRYRENQYDLTIYNIVRYFTLLMENNPNIIDSLFVPENCVLHCTEVGRMVRDNRKLFLHKGAYHRFRGYAFSQLHKIRTKTPEEGSKRHENVQEFGYDTKFAYHLVRLLDEAEQILTQGNLNLQNSREMLKAIRRGEWAEDQVVAYFDTKALELEKLYNSSTILPYGPDEQAIKELLLNCLEHHYGSLDKAVVLPGRHEQALRDIIEVAQKSLGIS